MLIRGDARMIPLADGVVQCCVTSPPYYGLRDYGTARWEGGDPECDHKPGGESRVGKTTLQGGTETAGHKQEGYRDICPKCGAVRVDNQIGLEETPDAYVAQIVAVFREVWRVLRDDGTVWLNLGDSYAGSWGNYGAREGNQRSRIAERWHRPGYEDPRAGWDGLPPTANVEGLKPKDLIGIPWRVAFALQADGWYLRSDIIWHKPNPMPESVTDRPTKSHEYVFLLSKAARYYYDADAIAVPCSENTHARVSQDIANQVGSYRANGGAKSNGPMRAVIKGSARKIAEAGSGIKQNDSFEVALALPVAKRNMRTVWTVGTYGYGGAHFATFPPALVEPMILAGSAEGDIVLDPFCGSGTTGMVARQHGRRFVGLDLNAQYLEDFALPRAEQKQTAASLAALPLFDIVD